MPGCLTEWDGLLSNKTVVYKLNIIFSLVWKHCQRLKSQQKQQLSTVHHKRSLLIQIWCFVRANVTSHGWIFRFTCSLFSWCCKYVQSECFRADESSAAVSLLSSADLFKYNTAWNCLWTLFSLRWDASVHLLYILLLCRSNGAFNLQITCMHDRYYVLIKEPE